MYAREEPPVAVFKTFPQTTNRCSILFCEMMRNMVKYKLMFGLMHFDRRSDTCHAYFWLRTMKRLPKT